LRIYTRTGDGGSTGLLGGSRVPKTHPIIEVCGAIDELNAVLGVAAASCRDLPLNTSLESVQSRLFDLCAFVATPTPRTPSIAPVPPFRDWVAALEAETDEMTEHLDPLGTFILPGGTPASAAIHHARTVCRRAERRLAAAMESGEDLGYDTLAYLNRLGDWLFTAARLANRLAGVSDTPVDRRPGNADRAGGS
jgi:cob(I)alamin adenosyltransferase